MSAPSVEQTLGMGNASGRSENPTVPAIVDAFGAVRAEVNEVALSTDMPFYDKVYALEASQGFLRRSGSSWYFSDTVQQLEAARKANVVMLRVFDGSDNLVVGKLDEQNAWNFENRNPAEKDALVDLRVRFSDARVVAGWRPVDGPRAFSGQITADPRVQRPDNLAPFIGIYGSRNGQLGSENLIGGLRRYVDSSIFLGEAAIHKQVALQESDEARRASLHAAVSIAIGQMARETA